MRCNRVTHKATKSGVPAPRRQQSLALGSSLSNFDQNEGFQSIYWTCLAHLRQIFAAEASLLAPGAVIRMQGGYADISPGNRPLLRVPPGPSLTGPRAFCPFIASLSWPDAVWGRRYGGGGVCTGAGGCILGR